MTTQMLIIGSDNVSHVKRISHVFVPGNNGRPVNKTRLRNTIQLDQRRFSRFLCLLVVDYVIDKRAYRDFVCNLCLSGAFINTRNRFPLGQKLVFVLNLVGGGICRTTAIVVRTSPSGVAVKFKKPILAEGIKAVFQPLLAGIAGKQTPAVLKPRRQSVNKGSRAKVEPMYRKLAQHMLVVTKNPVMKRYIINALSLRVGSVEFATSGFEAFKKIKSTAFYTILITDLLIDEVSGTALCIALKKKRTALVLGINNGSEICKAVAVESGFDMVFDSESTPAIVSQYFKSQNI